MAPLRPSIERQAKMRTRYEARNDATMRNSTIPRQRPAE